MERMDCFSANTRKNNQIATNDLIGTSAGVLPKWNITRNGVKYYIKAGKPDGMTLRKLEPVVEMIAFKIGKLMGVNITETNLLLLKVKATGSYREQECLVSYTRDFKTDGYTTYVPAIDLGDLGTFSYDCLGDTLEEFREEINIMLLFDFIIGNYDRHLNNFGVLKNEVTGDLKFAPIFDNGSALLNNYSETDLLELKPRQVDKEILGKPFNMTQMKQVQLVEELPKCNLAITPEDVELIVNEFTGMLTEYRRKRIINFIERRFHYVNTAYLKE